MDDKRQTEVELIPMKPTLEDNIERQMNNIYHVVFSDSIYTLSRGTEAERTAFAKGFVTKLLINKGSLLMQPLP